MDRPELGVTGESDIIQPFLLESSGIRGAIVRIDSLLGEIIARHDYPESLNGLLGDCVSLVALLGSLIKFDGIFTLQIRGEGPVILVVADMESEGVLRAYAGYNAKALGALDGAGTVEAATLPALFGKGYLAFTVDQRSGEDRYQGIVELTGDNLVESIQHYFLQSEQVRTGLVMSSRRTETGWRGSGIILQALPDEEEELGKQERDACLEDWRRAMVLLASCRREELLDLELSANDLLYRLFHEEGVRVFERRGLKAGCRCSREKLERTLQGLPAEDIADIRQDREIDVTCQFCSRKYHFDEADLERIFTP